jgi:hypothetical protein
MHTTHRKKIPKGGTAQADNSRINAINTGSRSPEFSIITKV